jgi:hypothetical protein
MDDDTVRLIAYRLDGQVGEEDLWAAPIKRVWMEGMPEKFANRCLPLLIANQSGWLLINTETVRLTWDGGSTLESITVDYDEEPETRSVLSHFGSGIVTWQVPYLFRTSPGWNLLVRGPANCPMDGIYPLEGVVETDWAPATFTMNWHLTRPGLTVTFPRGEPFAMVVPQRRGELESIVPSAHAITDVPEISDAFSQWSGSRAEFLEGLKDTGSDAHRRGWQKDYFQGRESGTRRQEHQTRLRLAEFAAEGGPVDEGATE